MLKALLPVLFVAALFAAETASAGYRCNLARRGCYQGGGKYNTYKKNANNYYSAVQGCMQTAERNGHYFCEVKEFTYTPGKGWFYCELARTACRKGGGRYNGLVKAGSRWEARKKCNTLASRNGHKACF